MNISTFCYEAASILQILGWLLTIFKIAIPLLIVFFGVFDFGKAVTAGKDDEIKKSAKTLMYRAIAGVIIFFVPTIVMWLFGSLRAYNEAIQNDDDYQICKDCILSPWKCTGEGVTR